MKKWKSYLQCYLLSFIITELLCCSMIIWCCVIKEDWSLFAYFGWYQIIIPFISLWTMFMLYVGIYVKRKENNNE